MYVQWVSLSPFLLYYVSPHSLLPQLVSLNLSNNRISNLSLYGTLATATPNLMALDLSGNSVSVCACACMSVDVCTCIL